MSLHVAYVPPRVNAALAVHEVLGEAAKAAADVVLEESQRLVPVDTGALAASGKVTREDGPSAVISYGQSDGAGRDGRDTADYAIPVHERMDVSHPIGQAKFLEAALHSAGARAIDTAAVVLRKALDV